MITRQKDKLDVYFSVLHGNFHQDEVLKMNINQLRQIYINIGN